MANMPIYAFKGQILEAGDWIVTTAKGEQHKYSNEEFHECFVPLTSEFEVEPE